MRRDNGASAQSALHMGGVELERRAKGRICLSVKAVKENTCLNLLNLNRAYTLQTDAIHYGLRVVFLQEHGSVYRAMAFASHTFTGAEMSFLTTEKKYLENIFELKRLTCTLTAICFALKMTTWLSGVSKRFKTLPDVSLFGLLHCSFTCNIRLLTTSVV